MWKGKLKMTWQWEVETVVEKIVKKMGEADDVDMGDTTAKVTEEVTVDEVIVAEQLVKVTEAEDAVVAEKLLEVKEQLSSKPKQKGMSIPGADKDTAATEEQSAPVDLRPKGVIITKKGPRVVVFEEGKGKGKEIMVEGVKMKSTQSQIDADELLARKLLEDETGGDLKGKSR